MPISDEFGSGKAFIAFNVSLSIKLFSFFYKDLFKDLGNSKIPYSS
jgi:hypothetical protein